MKPEEKIKTVTELSLDLRIDRNNLSEEVAEQSSKYVYYAAMLEETKAELETKKFELDVLFAELDKLKRIELKAAGGSVTETIVKQTVLRDIKLQEKKGEVIDWKKKVGVLTAVEKAYWMRKDMLSSIVHLTLKEGKLRDAINYEKASGNGQG